MTYYDKERCPETFSGNTADYQTKHRARYQCAGECDNHRPDKDLVNLIHFLFLKKWTYKFLLFKNACFYLVVYPEITLFSSFPISSISHITVSPGLSIFFSFIKIPTPEGVPVDIRSPASRAMDLEI